MLIYLMFMFNVGILNSYVCVYNVAESFQLRLCFCQVGNDVMN